MGKRYCAYQYFMKLFMMLAVTEDDLDNIRCNTNANSNSY